MLAEAVRCGGSEGGMLRGVKMKTILFTALFALTATVQAQPERPDTKANIHENGRVLLSFRGQTAKQIFEAMPKKSQLTEKENCLGDDVVKVQGGLICTFSANSVNPDGFYSCGLEVSAITGKVEKRTRTDTCPDPDEI